MADSLSAPDSDRRWPGMSRLVLSYEFKLAKNLFAMNRLDMNHVT